MERKEGLGNRKKTFKKSNEKFSKQKSNYKGSNRNFKKEDKKTSTDLKSKENVDSEKTENVSEKRKFVKKSDSYKNYRKNSDSEKRSDNKYTEKRRERPVRNTGTRRDEEKNTENRRERPVRNSGTEHGAEKNTEKRRERPVRNSETRRDENKYTEKRRERPVRNSGTENGAEKNAEKTYSKDKKTFTKSGDYHKKTYSSNSGRFIKKPHKQKKTKDESDGIRLNRYIAAAGFCSRREADTYITAGIVTINGKLVTELGVKVMPGDVVTYNNQVIKGERNVYLLLNKPKDYVTTLKDPHAKRTVMELIDRACKERIYPVGRLDRNTTGVLLFTNDGDLTTKLTHPKNKVSKIYHVILDKTLTKSDMLKISEGVELEDGIVKADKIAYADIDDKRKIGVEIHSGKNRVIRRIFEHLGYRVSHLDRASFAGLTKKNLKRGTWRFLTEKEIAFLKMLSVK